MNRIAASIDRRPNKKGLDAGRLDSIARDAEQFACA
jgi:hypothetical protein